jgi:hypothetical protein
MSLKRLNLGCGRNIKKDWVNLDSADLPGVDVVHNVENLPLPLLHFTSRNNYVDPTHKKLFSISTFEFFAEDSRNPYYFDFHFSKISYRKIKFLKRRIYYINRLIEPLINLNEAMQVFYESKFLSRLFPANDIVVELVK